MQEIAPAAPSAADETGGETAGAIVHGLATLYHLDLARANLITADPSLADTVKGTAGNDLMIAGGGDDFLNGLAGNDVLIGGAGHDTLYGSFGADVLFAGRGDNVLAGFGGTEFPGSHPPPWPYLQNNGPDRFVFDIRSSDPNFLGHDLVWDLTPDDHLVFHDLDGTVRSVADLDRLVTVTGEGQNLDIRWKDGHGEIEARLQNGPPEQHLADQYHSMADVAAHFHVDFVRSGAGGDWHFV
jgi:hypothetical protein